MHSTSPFHGAELASATVGDVRYRTSAFPSHFATTLHAHDEAYFCLVLEGTSLQLSGRSERVRGRGRVYYYPPGERQSERFGRDVSRLFTVEMVGAPPALASAARLPAASVELAGLAALLVRRLHLESRSDDALALEDLTMLLLGALSRESLDAPRWGSVVQEYLHAHHAEKLTLARIALAAGLHPVHLCRAFARRFGVTLGDYVRALRLDHAARQLVATRRAIAEIALEAGFSSQSHLTREMKRRMGTTPAAYRAALIG